MEEILELVKDLYPKDRDDFFLMLRSKVCSDIRPRRSKSTAFIDYPEILLYSDEEHFQEAYNYITTRTSNEKRKSGEKDE